MVDTRERMFPPHQGTVWRRALILVLLCAALAAAAYSANLHATLMAVLESGKEIIQRHPVFGALLFVLFSALSAMLAFVSAAVVVPVAVYVWGAPVSMLLLWTGWVLGGVCAYGVGRFLGRRVVDWLTVGAALNRLERRVHAGVSFRMVVLIQFALPSEIPGYVLGLTRYGFGKYLLAFAIAELPYTVMTVLLGANFVERRAGIVLILGLALVVLSVGAFYRLRKHFRTT